MARPDQLTGEEFRPAADGSAECWRATYALNSLAGPTNQGYAELIRDGKTPRLAVAARSHSMSGLGTESVRT